MKQIKRLLVWMMISIIPTLIIILVWLITAMSFNLIQIVQSNINKGFTLVAVVGGLITVFTLNDKEVDDIIA